MGFKSWGYRKRSTKAIKYRPELKFVNTVISDAVIAATWTFSDNDTLIGIGQGDTVSSRQGAKITLRKIMIRFVLTLPTTAVAASTADTVRIVVYQDKQANAAVGTEATLWTVSDDLTDWRNIQTAQRYRILHDKTISISSGGGSGRGTTDTLSYAAKQVSWEFYKDVNIPSPSVEQGQP